MKDVIYIDIEDDITAIIGKVKDAHSKIVALVPPKRPGVLQSVVNLKLLQKGASDVGKHTVLITSDHSLVALAAGLKIPVAKNLQSRPEIPHLASPQVDKEEVINGSELSVGELAAMRQKPAPTDAGKAGGTAGPKPTTPASPTPKRPPLGSKGGGSKFKIPNFGTFRKKIFLFGGLGLLLLILLIWAFVFAPKAQVTISARTTAVNIDRSLTLNPGLNQSKPDQLTLKPNVQEIKKDVAVEFDATGKKEVGEKASGDVTLTNSSSSSSVSVPSGAVFTSSSGKKFTLNSRVVIPGAEVENGEIVPGKATGTITASQIGSDYNLGSQGYSVQGYSNLNATGEKMSGGSKKEVTIVSAEDVQQAESKLSKENEAQMKNDLKQKFKGEDYIIIDESFAVNNGTPNASPGVGQEAQQAKLTLTTTYTLLGLKRDDVKPVLEDVVKDALKDKPDQQQYSLGENDIVFQTFQKDGNNYTTRLATTGYIGPKVDTKALAESLVGKRYGEIQAIAQEIPGVEDVEINFSPFWVTTAPGADKIEISFSVDNDNK